MTHTKEKQEIIEKLRRMSNDHDLISDFILEQKAEAAMNAFYAARQVYSIESMELVFKDINQYLQQQGLNP